jgi:TRAP-type C4-dicarboxylate transport system permease small subunit
MAKKRVFDYITDFSIKITLTIAVASAFGIIALTAIQIFTRTFFNFATAGLEEMCRYLLVSVTYFGSAYTLSEGGHVTIDFIQNKLSEHAKKLLHLFHCVVGLLFCLIMIYYSGILAWQNFIFNSKSNSIYEIPLVIPSAFVPLGFLCVIIVLISMMVKSLRNQHDTASEP